MNTNLAPAQNNESCRSPGASPKLARPEVLTRSKNFASAKKKLRQSFQRQKPGLVLLELAAEGVLRNGFLVDGGLGEF